MPAENRPCVPPFSRYLYLGGQRFLGRLDRRPGDDGADHVRLAAVSTGQAAELCRRRVVELIDMSAAGALPAHLVRSDAHGHNARAFGLFFDQCPRSCPLPKNGIQRF